LRQLALQRHPLAFQQSFQYVLFGYHILFLFSLQKYSKQFTS
jgi:hypothetical protein